MTRPTDERLVHAAVDPAGLAEELGAEAAAAFDAAHAEELAELRGFLAEARAAVDPRQAPGVAWSAQRVTRRVLARTTREEFGWRGDLRLVGDFVVDRLRASAWLRVAAALLIVQATVVPILAWHVLKAQRDPGAFQLTLERAHPPEFPDVDEPALLRELPVDLTAQADAAVAHAARCEAAAERLRAAARATLAAVGAEAFQDSALAAAPGSERLLGLRVLAVLETLGARPEGAADDARAALAALLGAARASGDATRHEATLLACLDAALDRRLLLGADPELTALVHEAFERLEDAPAGSARDVARRRLVAFGLLAPRGGEGDTTPESLLPAPAEAGVAAPGASTEVGPLGRHFAAALRAR